MPKREQYAARGIFSALVHVQREVIRLLPFAVFKIYFPWLKYTHKQIFAEGMNLAGVCLNMYAESKEILRADGKDVIWQAEERASICF